MSDTKVIFDKIYHLGGGVFGCWFWSAERNLPIGTVRMVRDRLFFVCYQHGTFFKPKTCWVPVDREYNSVENHSKFLYAVGGSV